LILAPLAIELAEMSCQIGVNAIDSAEPAIIAHGPMNRVMIVQSAMPVTFVVRAVLGLV
jgi:hypothetical protein